jgi:hypothetical protein
MDINLPLDARLYTDRGQFFREFESWATKSKQEALFPDYARSNLISNSRFNFRCIHL